MVNGSEARNWSKRQELPNFILINVLCTRNLNNDVSHDTYLQKKGLWITGSKLGHYVQYFSSVSDTDD